jgi:hypothetical protein
VRRLDRRIIDATATLSAAVAASGTTPTDLHGIDDVLAAKILARSGAASRFRSASAFASYCGVAPIEMSSGDVQRHRLSRAGRSPAELRAARHGHHPNPASNTRPGLLPAQTRSGLDPQGGLTLPKAAPCRRHLPNHDPRHGDLSPSHALTQRGAVRPSVTLRRPAGSLNKIRCPWWLLSVVRPVRT